MANNNTSICSKCARRPPAAVSPSSLLSASFVRRHEGGRKGFSHLGVVTYQLDIDTHVLLGEQHEIFVCQTSDGTKSMEPGRRELIWWINNKIVEYT
jgi:hypothetical protein